MKEIVNAKKKQRKPEYIFYSIYKFNRKKIV